MLQESFPLIEVSLFMHHISCLFCDYAIGFLYNLILDFIKLTMEILPSFSLLVCCSLCGSFHGAQVSNTLLLLVIFFLKVYLFIYYYFIIPLLA